MILLIVDCAGQIEDTTGNLVDELWLVKGAGGLDAPLDAAAPQPRRAAATESEQARIFAQTRACTSAGTRLPECAAL